MGHTETNYTKILVSLESPFLGDTRRKGSESYERPGSGVDPQEGL